MHLTPTVDALVDVDDVSLEVVVLRHEGHHARRAVIVEDQSEGLHDTQQEVSRGVVGGEQHGLGHGCTAPDGFGSLIACRAASRAG